RKNNGVVAGIRKAVPEDVEARKAGMRVRRRNPDGNHQESSKKRSFFGHPRPRAYNAAAPVYVSHDQSYEPSKIKQHHQTASAGQDAAGGTRSRPRRRAYRVMLRSRRATTSARGWTPWRAYVR